MGKGENADNQPFLTMFSIHPITNFIFSVPFILSSANAFNLEQSKILSFGKELRILLVGKKFKSFPEKKKFNLPNLKKKKVCKQEIECDSNYWIHV